MIVRFLGLLSAAFFLALAAPASASPLLERKIAAAAEWELREKAVPSIVVAIVDRNGVVWKRAWGRHDMAGKVPASTNDTYRVGSISKLFTDVAIMKLVEQGRIDLDRPVAIYLPSFHPRNPFGTPITLRQLLTHRSGLVREPPRGNYFDASPKGQADTVASLNETTLVAKPGTVTKYSNAAVAVAGEVLAHVTGRSYEDAVRTLVLQPLGMTDSHYDRGAVASRIPYSEMAAVDTGRFSAPPLDLGTPAAGNLFTTADDLAKFARALLNSGQGLLRPQTLVEMERQQFPGAEPRIFGIGFQLGMLDGQPIVGHGGDIYGFASDFRYLPKEGIAAIAFSTVDAGNTAPKLARYALSAWLAERHGRALPDYKTSTLVTGAEAQRLTGWFTDGKRSVAVRRFRDGLILEAPEMAGEIRKTDTGYLIEDAQMLDDDMAFAPDASWVRLDGVIYRRAEQAEPPLAPPAIASLVGEYGWNHNKLRFYQRDGQPFVRMEYTDYRPLTPVGKDVFAFPTDRGLYRLETVRFERDRTGAPVAAVINGIRFPRQDFGALAEAEIQRALVGNENALRAQALAASPPAETGKRASDLVALTAIDPTIRLDVKYARRDNLMGFPVYEKAAAYMQRPAAEALARINQKLRMQGYGLIIRDAYRPWFVTKMFWDSTPERFKIFPADPSKGSKHNRGAAVDLSLFQLKTGDVVEMPGRYDEYSDRSYSDYIGGTDHQRWMRDYLRAAMESGQYTVFPEEWWHFDFDGWQAYPLGNQSFTELERVRGVVPAAH